MKIAGWICLALGTLSFFGAALKGNNVFGPCFWIALGVFFLYRAYNRQVKDEAHNGQRTEKIKTGNNTATVESKTENELIEIADIHSSLSIKQKEAAMCLIAFFAGYTDEGINDTIVLLLKQAAGFFGLPQTPEYMSRIMQKYSDADVLIDTVITIKQRQAAEFLLLTCYDITRMSSSDQPYFILINIANDMGYDKAHLTELINKYK